MKKIVYIIPGYEESHLKQSGYKKIARFFKKQGITPVHIKIRWHAQHPATFKNYLDQFLKQVKKEPKAETYLLGFSFGAIIAFLAVPKIKPTVLILCSLSPYFKEDLKRINPKWLTWWKENFKKSDFSFNAMAGKITSKTYLVVGDREKAAALKRTRDAKKKIRNSSLTIAKGAKHNISQKEYYERIARLIGQLS